MQVMRTAWHCRRMSAVGQAEISADPKWTSLKRDQLAVFVRPSFRRSSHALGLSDLTAGHGCEFRALLETLTYTNGGDSFSNVAQLLQIAFGAAQVDSAGQSADRRCRYLDEPKSNLNFRSLGARQLKMMQAMPISDHLVRGEISVVYDIAQFGRSATAENAVSEALAEGVELDSNILQPAHIDPAHR